MTLTDLTGYIDILKHRGLTHLDNNGQAADLVVVDVRSGPREPCNWLHFGTADLQQRGSGQKASVMWARLKDGQSERLALPKDWRPGAFQFVTGDAVNKKLRFVRSDGNVDVFEDFETGKEVYIARTGV